MIYNFIILELFESSGAVGFLTKQIKILICFNIMQQNLRTKLETKLRNEWCIFAQVKNDLIMSLKHGVNFCGERGERIIKLRRRKGVATATYVMFIIANYEWGNFCFCGWQTGRIKVKRKR